MAAALALLLWLGTWQVQRLYWKEALIERVNSQLDAEPQNVRDALDNADNIDQGIDYLPVRIQGTFEPDQAFFEFTTFKGKSGWNVFHLLRLSQSSMTGTSPYALVNRGYIPYEAKENWQSLAPLPTGVQTIVGLLRTPPVSKPGSFMPDNVPDEATYYWRDLVSMATSAGLDPDEVSPWYVDAGLPGAKSGETNTWPISGTTIISFSNNHLQYAVTWYGLALALLGVGGYFLYARRKAIGSEDG